MAFESEVKYVGILHFAIPLHCINLAVRFAMGGGELKMCLFLHKYHMDEPLARRLMHPAEILTVCLFVLFCFHGSFFMWLL